MTVIITQLNIYPVKSCRGVSLDQAQLTATGFAHDREWLIVDTNGRFLTQRVVPRLALIVPRVGDRSLELTAPGMRPLRVDATSEQKRLEVVCWRDTCLAFDAGDEAAQWFSDYLHKTVRLVRFDPSRPRLSNREWTGEIEAHNQFSDGYPILVISESSLADLNSRLPSGVGPLPMNRFRPNVVVSGLPAYGEDEIGDIYAGNVQLRVVKPCTRCTITTTDQATAQVMGDEPLRTLRAYRFDARLKGVLFGQNIVIVKGIGERLRVGQTLDVVNRSS